jgi:hypothetical protein
MADKAQETSLDSSTLISEEKADKIEVEANDIHAHSSGVENILASITDSMNDRSLDEPDKPDSKPTKKQRRLTSSIWEIVSLCEDIPDAVRCKCGKVLRYFRSHGTSNIQRHIKDCSSADGITVKVDDSISGTLESAKVVVKPIKKQKRQDPSLKSDGEDDEKSNTKTVKKQRKLTSSIWGHVLVQPDNPNIVECKCGKLFKYNRSTGTSNIQRHIKECHVCLGIEITDDSQLKKPKEIRFKAPKKIKYDSDECKKLLMNMIETDKLSYSILDGEGFKSFIKKLQPDFILPESSTMLFDITTEVKET